MGAFLLLRYRLARPGSGRGGRCTQQELGDLIGCSAAYIGQIEGGKRPGMKAAIRLEALTGIGLQEWARPATCTNCRRSLSDLTLRLCDEADCPHLAQQLEAAE